MDDSLGAKLRKTAGDVAHRVGEAAHHAGERLSELREVQRLSHQIHLLAQEKERCRAVIADLVVRMFDQETFLEGMLRPEYERIKAIEVEIAILEKGRQEVGKRLGDGSAETTVEEE